MDGVTLETVLPPEVPRNFFGTELERTKQVSAVIQDVTGVILAGGRSSRFGQNKAFAQFHQKTFIERVLRVMRGLFSEVVLVTNTPQEFHSLPIKILVDNEPYQGPMGGITTALECSRHSTIFVVACDMPLLKEEVVREIVERGRGYDAAIPVHDAYKEYTMALYSKKLLGPMLAAIEKGNLSLKEFCKTITHVAWIPIESESAANVNTQHDLKKLEEHYAL